MKAAVRVVMFGLGPIGQAVARLLLSRPGTRIVGAIDQDHARVGRDLGQVLDLPEALGVVVTDDAEAGLAQDADVVVHCTGSYLTQVADQLRQCLESGKHVVSTCEELSFPWRKQPELSALLDAVAQRHGVVLHGTGVNPGFVMDKLPATISSVCQSVESIQVTRVVDASKRRLPLQRKIGAGLDVAAFEAAVADGTLKHHGLPESVAMLAQALGFELDTIDEQIEPVLAQERVKTEFLVVEPGQVAGVRQVCVGAKAGVPLATLELQMYVGAIDPADTVMITGVPSLTVTVPGGTHGDLATAATVVNAIPLVVGAEPGLRTALDLPVRYVRDLAVDARVRASR